MITGYGVAEAVRHYYETYGGDVKEKAIVQGFGNVGSAAAFYLAEMGAKYRYNRQRWRFNKRKRLYF
jgi:glutamate dehydrogenase/leucine dehydrogenase